jgi:hypothetical protein
VDGGDDTVDGGDDTVDGGDDTVDGGDDTVDGGDDTVEIETVTIEGTLSTASVSVSDDGSVAVEPEGGETMTFTGVEFLEFEDGMLAMDVPGSGVREVAQGYLGGLGREPDAPGLQFWVGRIASGGSTLDDFYEAIFGSTEFQQTFGPDEDPGAFVGRMYGIMYGRDGDEAGQGFWENALRSEAVDEVGVFRAFASSAEFDVLTDDLFENGLVMPSDDTDLG